MIPTIKALISGIQRGMGSYAPIIEEVEAATDVPVVDTAEPDTEE